MDKKTRAALQCCYTKCATTDVVNFASLVSKNEKIDAIEFCTALNNLVQHHLKFANQLTSSVAKLMDYEKTRKHTKEKDKLLKDVVKDLSDMLLYKYRPDD